MTMHQPGQLTMRTMTLKINLLMWQFDLVLELSHQIRYWCLLLMLLQIPLTEEVGLDEDLSHQEILQIMKMLNLDQSRRSVASE